MSSTLASYKSDFLQACISAQCLTFGTYTLKSGRISPYFFNAGLLRSGEQLEALANAFAHTLATFTPPLHFDVLFGPAYKGIPLTAITTMRLPFIDRTRFGRIEYSFNRKEAKSHGDGGSIVGSPLKGKKVVIIDDVMTAGTAIREAVDIIGKEGGTLVGIVVALDRMEKMPAEHEQDDEDGKPRPSTIGEVRRRYNVPVVAVLTLDDIIEGQQAVGGEENIRKVKEYREKYRPSD